MRSPKFGLWPPNEDFQLYAPTLLSFQNCELLLNNGLLLADRTLFETTGLPEYVGSALDRNALRGEVLAC
jgi:hypothetical protein